MVDQQSLQRFLDESSIRDAVALFADAATWADDEAFRSLWADRGEFIISKAPQGHRSSGKDGNVALFKSGAQVATSSYNLPYFASSQSMAM